MQNKIPTIILSIILFLVPVLIIPNSKDNYNLLKIIVLLICGFALLIMLLIKCRKIKEIKFDATDGFALAFGLMAIVSTVFSCNVKQSILGAPNRYEGVLTIITYLLIYYNAKYYFQNYKSFENIGIVAYMSICILAIIQFYLPTNVCIIPIFGKGAHGTFGNTNFMGNFISIILPAFICKYIITSKKKYLICSIISFLVMIMCIARSCWVAFVIYFLMIVIYVIIKKDKKCWQRLFILFISFALCFMIIQITEGKLSLVSKGRETLVSDKISIMKSEIREINKTGITEKMGSRRIQIWSICYKMLLRTPIIGCGVDALNYGLSTFVPIESLEYIITHKTYIDKAHNEYLQIAATMGIPALAIYLGFISMIIVPNIKKMFKDQTITVVTIIILSYLAQAFFNISTIGIAPIFWFILGIASRYTRNKENFLIK